VHCAWAAADVANVESNKIPERANVLDPILSRHTKLIPLIIAKAGQYATATPAMERYIIVSSCGMGVLLPRV
jgi:hypothetical protein